MNKDILLQLFKAPYKRQNFIDNVIVPIFKGKVANITIYENSAVVPIRLTDSEAEYVKSAVKYGEIITADELPRTIELYEVIVDNTKQIERSRVGLNALVKKHIIGDNAVMVNFAYDIPENRSWRFSFIARDGVFQDGEMKAVDTNPKRYTYVFGQPDETFKTAIDRFTTLANEFEITINKIKDAFSVEAMSKAFFDDYRDVHYAGFVDYLMRSNFHKSVFNGNDKDVRDFVKKLLGRIVFLYFLQKKGWMGASNTEYKDGDKNFISNYFRQSGADDAFYPNWLTKLFFEALNSPRTNDDFVLPNGKTVKIPYLNGGLFEKQSEKYDFLTFPAEMFENLFNFFDQYNFTIFEDSPEEHTVAVDPEMLGHIFENLLEDNKDKGAFYTPKEIVHYMTQESLIEYLHTQLPDADKNELEAFIKNKPSNLSNDIKAAIGQKLDTVKICDPAIGSGAFPMGLLQEIYSIKERIAFDLHLPWDNTQAAATKANIIQNSIYGVDIERGAVDIARLRFWLSLIVDEEKPKSLPNLDYKIVVGNSLVSKFEDTIIEIDWDRKNSVGSAEAIISELQSSLKELSEIQRQFFGSPTNDEKKALKKQIRELKLNILHKQISFDKIAYLNKNQKVIDMGLGLKPKDHKKNQEIDKQITEFDIVLGKLEYYQNNPDESFSHFDWKLNFPEVLNHLVNENCGFDIVIGNPPYGVSIKGDYRDQVLNNFGKVPDFEIYYFFTELAYRLTKENGVKSFIIPNTFLFNTFAENYRVELTEKWNLVEILDCTKFNIFQSATVRNAITLWRKGTGSKVGYRQTKNKNSFRELISSRKVNININQLLDINQNWGLAFLLDVNTIKTINKIKLNKIELQTCFKISQGYIPYRRSDLVKLYGKEEGNKIVDERLWHSDEKVNSDFIPEIFGRELNKFGIINKTKISYIKYGKHVASYVDLDFFSKERVLVREITNPRIIATILEDTYANDPQLISIINKDKYNRNDLLKIWAILNSNLATYYHFNNSPKATKGAFPKILIKDLKEFPIPRNFEELKLLTVLVDYALNTYRQSKLGKDKSTVINDFEEIIDALVFELYFPEDFKEKNIEIAKHAEELFKPLEGLTEEEQLATIEEVYNKCREKSNPLRNQIKLMKIELSELLLPILSM